MSARLRRADVGDLDAIVAIKEALRLEPGQGAARGGFLLGCSRERYAALIEAANVLLLEDRGEVAGFAVTLPDAVLRASELWARRDLIRWHAGEGEPPPGESLAYFDQLALRPAAPRLYVPALALAAVRALAEAGHVHLYATTLSAPISNRASLPLLRAIGARPVGTVEEHYEEVGRVVSELHHVRLQEALASLCQTRGGARTVHTGLRLVA